MLKVNTHLNNFLKAFYYFLLAGDRSIVLFITSPKGFNT